MARCVVSGPGHRLAIGQNRLCKWRRMIWRHRAPSGASHPTDGPRPRRAGPTWRHLSSAESARMATRPLAGGRTGRASAASTRVHGRCLECIGGAGAAAGAAGFAFVECTPALEAECCSLLGPLCQSTPLGAPGHGPGKGPGRLFYWSTTSRHTVKTRPSYIYNLYLPYLCTH